MKKVILMLILFMSGLGLMAVTLPDPIQSVDEISVSVNIDTVESLDLNVEQFAFRVIVYSVIKSSNKIVQKSFYCSKVINFKAGNKGLYIEGVPLVLCDIYIITKHAKNSYFLETEGNRVKS